MEQNKYITRNYYRSISTMTSVEIERGPVGGRRSYKGTIEFHNTDITREHGKIVHYNGGPLNMCYNDSPETK